eukprot:3941489-Rhodomonas_salina.2
MIGHSLKPKLGVGRRLITFCRIAIVRLGLRSGVISRLAGRTVGVRLESIGALVHGLVKMELKVSRGSMSGALIRRRMTCRLDVRCVDSI